MIVMGLTGSIGMGKSTVAAMFRGLGVPVFDADAEVHKLQGPAGRLLAQIEAAWPGTTGVAGVDRLALARAVLGDKPALLTPEGPEGELLCAFLRRHRARRLVVLDVPLLFEKGGSRRVDAVAVVSAPAWMQARRVLARPGMTAARLAQIRALQTPDAEKRRRADFVLDTGTSRAETRAQVRRLVACLRARAGRYGRSCAKSSLIPRPPA